MRPSQVEEIFKRTFPFVAPEALDQLLAISQYRVLSNKEILIRSGQRSRQVFFTLQGMIRGYFINQKGEEKNIFLRPEHTITGAPESLFRNEPTRYNFESILESHLLLFELDAYLDLAQKYPSLYKVYIAGLQENIQTLIGRVEALIDRSPEERYQELIQRSPQFFQKAFHKHIANYLGITPVSLSRIIKRMQSKDFPDS